MREGWQSVELGSFMEFKNGLNANKDAYGSGVKFVNVMDIFRSPELHADKITGSVQASPKAASEYSVVHGDILFNRTSETPEDIAFASVYMDAEPITFGGFVIRGRQTRKLLDPEFCKYVFRTDNVRRETVRRCQGAVRANIGQQDLSKVPLKIPPFAEQRKIAAILQTWDEAIEKLNALRSLNIRRRVWLRTHLFTGKVRLPGFTGEWRKVRLSDVLHEHRSKSTGAEEVYSVSVHKGLVNQVEHLGRSFSAANTDHYNRVLPGDIVYTKSPTGDFPLGIIKQSKIDSEVIVSPLYGVFTPESYALGVILDALFESPLAARNYLHPLVQKGAKNTIAVTNKQFLEGKLHLPMDPDEQAAIANVVNASHAELACLDAEIKALTDQKRGLMQKLLTGEWRVKVSDDEEAAA
ncbi:restriction endonuclease subunit S [Gymnodinialimonas ulvae]|uniref:restriction endonuclease subunit S n=1 Tax=Gymnodinialimonas ulvae TaxID=3126504 RepID=UPI0030948E05